MPARRAPLVHCTALLAALGAACASAPPGAAVGQRLPPLPTAAGLSSPWEGAPAVIVAWTSDCRPCRALAAEAALAPLPPGINLLHVNPSDSPALAAAQAAALGLPGAPLHGPPGPLLDALAIDALPLVLFVDADGVVRARGAVWADARATAARWAAD